MECSSQPKSIKPKMRWHKLETSVYWEEALKKRHKTNGHKTRPGCIEFWSAAVYPSSHISWKPVSCFVNGTCTYKLWLFCKSTIEQSSGYHCCFYLVGPRYDIWTSIPDMLEHKQNQK